MKEETKLIKICRKCKRELPLTDKYYQKNKRTIGGYNCECKECKGGSFTGEKVITVWTDEEVNILKKYYNDYLNIEIKENFLPNKTVRSIDAKAHRLGLGNKTEEAKKRALQNMGNTKKEYFKTHDGDAKGYKHTEESRKKMSIAKKVIKKWQGSDNPRSQNPLFGKDNGRWRGGITDLYKALRNELGDWQRQSMEFCKYKCVITNGEFEDIHHLYPFKVIMESTFISLNLDMRTCQNDYTEEEWNLICKKLLEIHSIYGFGACLNKEVHMLFHDNYNYINFTFRDFLDFIYRIDTGEFDKWFEENKLKIDINYDYVEYLENILLNLEESVAS